MTELSGASRVVGVYIRFDLFGMLIASIATSERERERKKKVKT